MYTQRFQNQRKNLRLKKFAYSSPGAYFVTVCTQSRDTQWFGAVTQDGMQLNAVGKMILEKWHEIPQFYTRIQIDAFIIMPDHIHGINFVESHRANTNPHQKIVGADSYVRPAQANGTDDSAQAFGESGQTRGSVPTDTGNLSLSAVMQRFKVLTTNLYICGVREFGWQPFEKRLWERSFYERVLRDDLELETRRQYILNNPKRWLETRGAA